MPDKPEHFDVRDSDDLHAMEWTPAIEVMIRGFDRVFVAEAKRAAERAADAARQSEAPGVAGAAAAAILLSAAACEARLRVRHRTLEDGRREDDQGAAAAAGRAQAMASSAGATGSGPCARR